MTWTYSQSTGMLAQNGQHESTGYSGFGECKNDPNSQHLANRGPIPRGFYEIGTARDTQSHGPFVLPLTPYPATNTCDRSGFLIHGDSTTHPGAASEGCIILAREARERIAASLDNELEVTE